MPRDRWSSLVATLSLHLNLPCRRPVLRCSQDGPTPGTQSTILSHRHQKLVPLYRSKTLCRPYPTSTHPAIHQETMPFQASDAGLWGALCSSQEHQHRSLHMLRIISQAKHPHHQDIEKQDDHVLRKRQQSSRQLRRKAPLPFKPKAPCL